jgi:fermentation-respiration switch protein FrsA (DUF1100 family)
LWLGLGIVVGLPLAVLVPFIPFYLWVRAKYLQHIVRIFQEVPLFIVPRGQPIPGAEDVRLETIDGLTLAGCYLRTPAPRRGVILFGLEFGSNRWACRNYCEHLLANGYDVFAFESRGQGDSEVQPGYEPIQWVTDFEVRDVEAALTYLKARPDADPRGVGFFGISKGGGAGVIAAARDPYVRCLVTDGIYGAYCTMIPYMRKWFSIYNRLEWIHRLIPYWLYGRVALWVLGKIEEQRAIRFAHLEWVMKQLSPRPLLMIHGQNDTYIKPEMARDLFDRARAPKEFWLVPGAKHNQALHAAGAEYRRRVLEFFDRHLADTAALQARPDAASDPDQPANGKASLGKEPAGPVALPNSPTDSRKEMVPCKLEIAR